MVYLKGIFIEKMHVNANINIKFLHLSQNELLSIFEGTSLGMMQRTQI